MSLIDHTKFICITVTYLDDPQELTQYGNKLSPNSRVSLHSREKLFQIGNKISFDKLKAQLFNYFFSLYFMVLEDIPAFPTTAGTLVAL